MRSALPGLLASLGFGVLLVVGLALLLPNGGAPRPTLADAINGACRPGYHVADWTTGDEFDPLPAGTVQVTCEGPPPRFGTYVVAVQRG